jgi:hypothetical protein
MKDFDKAYIKYEDVKKCNSKPPKSGKSLFSYNKIKFHHISIGSNKVDFLLHNGIVICTFPFKKDRNEIYEFIDRHFEVIKEFTDYIDKRLEDEGEIRD